MADLFLFDTYTGLTIKLLNLVGYMPRTIADILLTLHQHYCLMISRHLEINGYDVNYDHINEGALTSDADTGEDK
jgi:hypothetical protein